MTTDYKAVQQACNAAHDLPQDHELLSKNLPWDFPLERARLRHIPWITAIFTVSVGLYGFSMDGELLPWLTSRPGWIAVPLTLASWHYGPRWRRERLARLEKAEEEEQDATMASVTASVMATSTTDLKKK